MIATQLCNMFHDGYMCLVSHDCHKTLHSVLYDCHMSVSCGCHMILFSVSHDLILMSNDCHMTALFVT